MKRGLHFQLSLFIRFMRISTLVLGYLLSTVMVAYCAKGYGQHELESRITLHLSHVKLPAALEEISDKMKVKFFYAGISRIKESVVSVKADNKKLRDVLGELLQPLGLGFDADGNQIYIATRPPEKKIPAPVVVEQAQPIKGQVWDKNGQALIGVTIFNKSNGKNTLTDELGTFTIAASDGDTLHFTMIGMKPEDVVVKGAKAMKVTLEDNVSKMNELVVVGFGTQKKISVTGAVSTVKVDQLKTPNRSLANSLGGRVAGVIMQQSRGEPGYDEPNTFNIRGVSTFTGNSNPMVLVDGVQRDDQISSWSNIDPEDIESVSFLKDASATAVYGARGANGVVLITTKRGVAGKPRIAVKIESGTSGLTQKPDFIDGATWMTLYNEALGRKQFSDDQIEKTRSKVDPYLYPDINWVDAMYRDWSPAGYNVNLSVNGGGAFARYYVSGSFFDQKGSYKLNPENPYNSNVGYRRYDFRSNVDMSLTKSTTLSLSLAAMLVNANYPGVSAQDAWYNAMMQPPTLFPIRYPDGKWAGPVTNQGVNPVNALQNSGYSNEFKPTMQSVFTLNQKLDDLTEGLSATGRFSFDSYSETTMRRRKNGDTWLAYRRDVDGNLVYTQTNYGDEFMTFGAQTVDVQRTMYMEANLNYDRLFNGKHRVGALLLYNMREKLNGSAGDAIGGIPYRNQGLAARATYAYKDRYLAEFNIGATGSENFEKNSRFGVFPSMSVGWVVSEESFFSGLKQAISLLKIRGSYGTVGNDRIGYGERFPYVTTYAGGNGAAFGYVPQGYGGIFQSKIGVQGLSWEVATKNNIGLDLEFFGKLNLNVDFFKERREKILVARSSQPAFLGTTAGIYSNLGIMDNKGIDGALDYSDQIGDLKFNLYGTFTYASNKIVENDEPIPLYPWLSNMGYQVGQIRGFVAEGLFTDEAEISKHAEQKFGVVRPGDIKYKDINTDGVIDVNDMVPIGNTTNPKIMFGAGMALDFHGFHVEGFFQGAAQVDIMLISGTGALDNRARGIIPFMGGLTSANLYKEVTDRWTVDNPRQDVTYPRLSIASPGDNNYQQSTWWLRKADYVRLKNVQIGYSFRPSVLKAIRLQTLYVYASGQNLLTFSKFKMWDPELNQPNGTGYPPLRAINFGIKTNF
ncbi:SusC/RagA family TonB-linked outer membrane protein [Chitinophaga defluvii]|uniref:TonB-dependent receptor n=1 Tax=Chitinophaga defluvii TaxID=3163343 RepID=A0ABV2TA25_9BACT